MPLTRVAGYALSARRHVRRRGHQLLAVLRGRREGRAVPDRQGRLRGADQPRRGRRLRLARLPADRHAGPAVRLPGPRPVGSRGRAPLRSEQAAAGSRTASPSTATSSSPRRCSPTTWMAKANPTETGGTAAAGRFARPHHDQRRHQPVLRLGVRPRTPHPVPRDGDLRGARQGHDADASWYPRGAARHLRRAGSSRRSSTTSSR